MVDRYDEPLQMRCQGFMTDAAALSGDASVQTHPSQQSSRAMDDRREIMVASDFKIGKLLALLHLQPFDNNIKQKVSTGLLSQLVIPDTVAFCTGDPAFPCWYFTSKADPGTIKRKNSYNLTPRNIVEAFTKQRKRTVNRGNLGIVAVLVSDAQPNTGISEMDDVGEAKCEYLDEVGLRHFLDRRVATFSGILQQWVDPKGTHNSQLHCLWASSLCQVTCKTNTRALSDKKCSMYQRAVTFDGAECHTNRDPVSSQTHNCVEQICNNMAKHIDRMTEGRVKITTFSSYWKVRPDGRVVFLWCSALKVAGAPVEDGPPQLLPSRAFSPLLSVPHEVDSYLRAERGRPYVCPVSNKVLGEHDARHFITYKMIIAEWDATHRVSTARQRPSSAGFRPSSAQTPRQPPPDEAALVRKQRPSSARTLSHRTLIGDSKERTGAASEIPPLIHSLESLSEASLYRRLLTDASFLYKRVRVTEEVFQRFSKYVESAEQLDKDLLTISSGHENVILVPNMDMRISTSRASARSGPSPFIDIIGDSTNEFGVPLLPLWRLSPLQGPVKAAAESVVKANSNRSPPRSGQPPARSSDDWRVMVSNFRAGLAAPPSSRSVGMNQEIISGVVSPGRRQGLVKRDRETVARIRTKEAEALDQHKNRLKAAANRHVRRQEFPAGALPAKVPVPPPRPREKTAAGLLAEGRRANPRIGGSLKAMMPKLRLARVDNFMDFPELNTDKENSRSEVQLTSRRVGGSAGPVSSRALAIPLQHISGTSDAAPESLRSRPPGLGMLNVPEVASDWAIGRVVAAGQHKKVRRLQEELETHVSAHTSQTRVVHDLMELARQQFSLPPLPRTSTAIRKQDAVSQEILPPTLGAEKLNLLREQEEQEEEEEEEQEALRLGEAPKEWRGGGEGLEILNERQKEGEQMQGDAESDRDDGADWSDGETASDDLNEYQFDDESFNASDGSDAEVDVAYDSHNERRAPSMVSEEDFVKEKVMGSLMASLDTKEQGFFLEVLQQGHCL